jgi:DNA-binding MarR family transcriptional regulator
MQHRPDSLDLEILNCIKNGTNWSYKIAKDRKKTQSVIREKLKRLEELGYVQEHREDKRILYELTREGESLRAEATIIKPSKLQQIGTVTAQQLAGAHGISIEFITENPVQVQTRGADGEFLTQIELKGSATCRIAPRLTPYINTFGSPTWIRCRLIAKELQ